MQISHHWFYLNKSHLVCIWNSFKVQISTKSLPYHVLSTEDDELITGHNYLVFHSSLNFEKVQQLPPPILLIFSVYFLIFKSWSILCPVRFLTSHFRDAEHRKSMNINIRFLHIKEGWVHIHLLSVDCFSWNIFPSPYFFRWKSSSF